jgi:hypothetical protein
MATLALRSCRVLPIVSMEGGAALACAAVSNISSFFTTAKSLSRTCPCKTSIQQQEIKNNAFPFFLPLRAGNFLSLLFISFWYVKLVTYIHVEQAGFGRHVAMDDASRAQKLKPHEHVPRVHAHHLPSRRFSSGSAREEESQPRQHFLLSFFLFFFGR